MAGMLAVSALLLSFVAPQQASEEAKVWRKPVQPVATYSVVARDERTGEMGVAVQSHWFSVGSIVTWAEAGVGAVATQSFAREAYGPELLAAMRGGMPPEQALVELLKSDPGAAVRQVAAVDARGRTGAHTGESCIAFAGHQEGPGWSVQANIMANDRVVSAMAAAVQKDYDSLAERLLATLDAAQMAGGDQRGRQSAAMLVVSGEKQDEPWQGVLVDLRVEDDPEPLAELRRLLRVQWAYRSANRGDMHLEEGDMEAALEAYAAAEQLLPEQVELTYWRAVALMSKGERDAAFASFRKVFAANADWVAMTPRLVAAGHLQADEALLAEIAALAPKHDLRQMLDRSDPGRIESDVRTLVSFGTRHTLSDTKSDTRGIGAARRWLRDEMRRISQQFHDGRLQVELAPHQIAPGRRMPDGGELMNVVATLPGTDPDRLIVISGHYDSRNGKTGDFENDAPGANDDGSGTAACLEVARLMGGLQPRATVVFMCVAGEEQGLYGAAAQAKQWKEEGKTVEAMMTMDIVGGVRGSSGQQEPWRLRVFSEGVPTKGRPTFGSDNDASSRQLARYLKRAAAGMLPGFELTLVFRQDRYLRGGDHKPFFEMGWPAIRLTEPHENYDWQHQDVRTVEGTLLGDLAENVDYDYVSRVARSVGAAIGELAQAPASPEQVQVDTTELTPHTKLLWKLGAAPDLAGYHIVMRRTHEPDWTHRRDVGKVSEIVLEGFSKDDWLFGVQAVDTQGNRSLPVYPTPKFR